MVLSHVGIIVSSCKAAKEFYLAALAPLGYKVYYEEGDVVGLADAQGAPDFWLSTAKEGKQPNSGVHVAFTAPSREAVDQFYEAALKAGAKDNGPPGLRNYTPTYYAAFVYDADGNNIEAVHI